MLRTPQSTLSIFLILLNFLIIGYLVLAISGLHPFTAGASNEGPLFGAIARGQSSKELGYSTKMKSREAAEQAALANCHANCSVAVWFQDACGAYAEGVNGWGANFGATMDEARSKAKSACTAYASQQECQVKLVACSAGSVESN